MQQVHDINLENIKDEIFYFIPLKSCAPCVSMNLEMLSKATNKNVTLILISDITDNKLERLKKVAEYKYKRVLYDKKALVNYYETGIGKPLLLHIKNGKTIYFLNVSDKVIQEAHFYLDK